MEQSKFILAVQSKTSIWNPRIISNYDRIIKRQAWEEVAAQMYDNFHNFSDDEKREAVMELQRKWKSLTDYYKRRNPKEDIDEKTKRTKPIVGLLQFLDKIPGFENTYYYSNTYKQAANKHKSADESHFVEDNIIGHESNMNFLQMLLEELQCLNDQQRFKFKLGVMKLIKKIKYDDDEENTYDQADTTQQNVPYDCSIASFESPLRFASSRLTISRCNEQIDPTFDQTNNCYAGFDFISAEQPELDVADFSQKLI